MAFAPYGERYAAKNSPAFTFTGQNEDNVSGLYDFLYREESNAPGRWISPDPAGLSAVNIANPQTWNRYTYVGNNPLSFTDQLGLFQGDALGNGDDGCYLTFSCTVFTDSFGMQISSQFAQQALHNGSGVICQSCFGQAEQIGADNSISAVAVDFFRKDCSGPVSGGLAGALGNCTTSFIGSGLIQVGMLADIWYPPAANNMTPDVPLNPNAVKIFTEVYHRAAPIGNPCFYGAWAIGATAAGTVGAATANYQTIQAAAAENYPTLFTKVVNWLFGKAANPGR